MAFRCVQVDLPYRPEQVFDLVADIERYPLYLPHVTAARIVDRKGDTLRVDQVVSLGPLRLRFRTTAVLDRPRRITVTCRTSPFGAFREEWLLAPGPADGTTLSCRAEFEIRSGLAKHLLAPALEQMQNATVRAFTARAAALYGPPPAGPAPEF